MLDLPINFLKFWYPDALTVFLRSFKNTLQVIEEDLAVSLMWRLLLTPLFHDASTLGRILSFFFRLSRVIFGLFAYLLITILFILLTSIWFLTPLLLLTSLFAQVIQGYSVLKSLSDLTPIFIFGLGLFIHKSLAEPAKKTWQVKDIKDIWECTRLKKQQINFKNLLDKDEIKKLLYTLELDPSQINSLQIEASEKFLKEVFDLAKITQARFITAEYFFVGLLISSAVENQLLKLNLKLEDFKQALDFLEHQRQKWRKVYIWDEDFSIKHLRGVNRGWLGVPTPILDSVSDDLTRIASSKGFEDFLGRKATISEVVSILSQQKDRNVLLVGPPGSGKSSLVEFLAKQIVSGNAPDALATKRVVELDLSKILVGIKGEGDLAAKLKAIFDEISFAQNIIIFIDEMHNLGVGQAGGEFNLFSLLTPYLEEGGLQFIASTETESYSKIIEKNTTLARVFHKVELSPASFSETFEILKERVIELARYKKITLTFTAVKTIVELSNKLIHERVLPDSALYILEECEARAKEGSIDSNLVKQIFEERVQIPVMELNPGQKDLLLNLESVIHQNFIDQEEAVKAVSDTLRRNPVDLKDDGRPIGSFLFVGPTGVGKTELAKTLALVYFNANSQDGSLASSSSSQGLSTLAGEEKLRSPRVSDFFLSFDMSEYQTPQAVDRLIGTVDLPGELTEAVRLKPYCLILLDEFEKADPKILNLFLQVFEDGRLTDGRGVTTDFRSTIIIATSNAASILIAEELKKGANFKDLEIKVKEELPRVFKPELINRFDKVVIFKPLAEKEIELVVQKELSKVLVKLKEKGYLIEFSNELIEEISKKGFDPSLGARPLRRLIQDTLEANLSKLILEEKIKKGTPFKVGIELL